MYIVKVPWEWVCAWLKEIWNIDGNNYRIWMTTAMAIRTSACDTHPDTLNYHTFI